MYDPQKNYSIQSIIGDAINMIKKSAEPSSDVTLFDVLDFVEDLNQAPKTWLNMTWNDDNINECKETFIDKLSSTNFTCTPCNTASPSTTGDTLLCYQFGESCQDRLEWIAYWHCTGGKNSFCYRALYIAFRTHVWNPSHVFPKSYLRHLWMRRKFV